MRLIRNVRGIKFYLRGCDRPAAFQLFLIALPSRGGAVDAGGAVGKAPLGGVGGARGVGEVGGTGAGRVGCAGFPGVLSTKV